MNSPNIFIGIYRYVGKNRGLEKNKKEIMFIYLLTNVRKICYYYPEITLSKMEALTKSNVNLILFPEQKSKSLF